MHAVARRFLAGEIGLIQAARDLSPFWDIVEPELEPYLRVFVGINSETDALPVGDQRKHWAVEAIERQDEKIANEEQRWHKQATYAAMNLIQMLDLKS
jgi:hypothetical protein